MSLIIRVHLFCSREAMAEKYLLKNQMDIQDIICKWLKTRQQVIISYSNICNIQAKEQNEHINKELSVFFQLIIDYVSIGQLKIFESIVNLSDSKSAEHIEKNRDILAKLLQTTIAIVEINDKYADNNECSSIEKDLTKLGIIINTRLELEDAFFALHLSVEELKRLSLQTQQLLQDKG